MSGWLALTSGTLAFGQNANQNCTKEIDQQVTSGLTGTLTFQDACGTQSNTFEMKVAGGPATNSVTISGCMRGGTCTALTTSASTTATNLSVSGGPFDNYQIAWTLTGGASPALTFNRTGTYAKSTPGAYSGIPNAVTVAGTNHIYRGSDLCNTLGLATLGDPTGALYAYGYTGTQVCQPGTVNGTVNASFSGEIYLAEQLVWYLPLQSSGAAASNFPLQGVVMMPPSTRIHGRNTTGSPGAISTTIRACPVSGGPTGCTAPQSHNFAITATSLTTVNAHTYLGFTVAGADVQGAEPIRISNYQNVANNSFSLTACQPLQTANARLDPNCPAYPTSTLIYAAVNSGIWSASISAGGAAYSGTLTVTWTGGGCTIEPTAAVTQSGGVINAVAVQNRGRGCTSAPTATIAGSGGGAGGTLSSTIATACASNCGTLHAELPLFDTAPFGGTTFSQGIDWLTISCGNDPDCVPIRSLSANEQGDFHDLFLTQFQERCIDIHLFKAQNANALAHIRCSAGPSWAGDQGTEAIYISETGPHGIVDFTGDFTTATVPLLDCIRINSDYTFMYVMGGHCENSLYGILGGSGNPFRGVHISDWSGAPQGVSLTTGPYQTEIQSAVKIRSEYYTNSAPVTTVITGDYILDNITRNSATAGAATIVDDNPLGVAGQGFTITDVVTALYSVDQATSGCTVVNSSASFGMWSTCTPWNITGIAPKVSGIGGLSPCTASQEGMQQTANNCNAACTVGGTCTAGGAVHCSMSCNHSGAWVETGLTL